MIPETSHLTQTWLGCRLNLGKQKLIFLQYICRQNKQPKNKQKVRFVKVFMLLAFSVLTTGISAQEPGSSETESTGQKEALSPDSAEVTYYFANEQGAYTQHTFSKPLNAFQNYNPLTIGEQNYANLGNTGSAASPLFFSIKPNSDFRFKPDVFFVYKLKFDSIKIYQSVSPFSQIKYYMGKAKEQKLDFNISQRIGNGFYVGLQARYANAPGLYSRQRAYYAGATAFATLTLPSNRYGAIASFLTDRFSSYENGGLVQPDNFIENTEPKREVYQVNLSNSANRGKCYGFLIQHYFNILKKQNIQTSDSSQIAGKRKFDAGRFVHTFRYNRSGDAYQDSNPDIGNYPVFYNDSLSVFDTVRLTHIENCLVYSNEEPDTSGKAFPLQYSFGIRQQTDKLRHNDSTDIFNQVVPFGYLKGIIKGKTFFKASARLVIGGYNSGDYSMQGSFYQFFGKTNNKLYLNVEKGLSHPDYFYNHYQADNFRWEHSFGQQDIIKGEFGMAVKGYGLNVSITRVSNYTYLDQYVQPEQFTGGLAVFAARFDKEFIYKHWITNVFINVQQLTPDTLLRLPAFLGKLTVCYDVVLFNKALHAQFGLGCLYHSEWRQDAYMPALRSFYKQNYYTSGNYPYLDAFVNLNVKRARIFIKYEHFNAGMMGYNYMVVPYYPYADAAFKFGVSWVFFD